MYIGYDSTERFVRVTFTQWCRFHRLKISNDIIIGKPKQIIPLRQFKDTVYLMLRKTPDYFSLHSRKTAGSSVARYTRRTCVLFILTSSWSKYSLTFRMYSSTSCFEASVPILSVLLTWILLRNVFMVSIKATQSLNNIFLPNNGWFVVKVAAQLVKHCLCRRLVPPQVGQKLS